MNARTCREAAMSPAVSRWLEAQSLTPYVEVPHFGSTFDMVGVSAAKDHIVVVEMKTWLNRRVVEQARCGTACADRAYAAVSRRPSRSRLAATETGSVGILHVAGENVVVIREAKPCNCWGAARDRLLARIARMLPGGVGGKPNLKGEGPAQSCMKACVAYRAEHPAASWKEMFANVHNHYASAQSMRSSLKKLILWRKIKATDEMAAMFGLRRGPYGSSLLARRARKAVPA